MTRFLLQILLPLALPFAVYWLWLVLTRRSAGKDARETVPWTWLFLAGAALAIVSLVWLGLNGGGPPGARYVPPHLENGEVVPARIEPAAPQAPSESPSESPGDKSGGSPGETPSETPP